MNRGDSGLGFPVSTFQGVPSNGIAGGIIGQGSVSSIALNSNDNIQAGDLVVLASDNNAYYATDPTNTYASQLRPIFNATAQKFPLIRGNVSTAMAEEAFGSDATATAVLSNGNIVMVGGSTGGASNWKFVITDQWGNIVQGQTDAGMGAYSNGGGNVYLPAVCALPGGGFVIAGVTSQSVLEAWHIYAAFFVNSTTVPTVVMLDTFETNFDDAGLYSISCCALSNGNVAFQWVSTCHIGFGVDGGCRTTIWNPNTAAVVVAAQAVNGSTYSTVSNEGPVGNSIIAFNGGYVCTYAFGAQSFMCFFTNAGVAGTVVQMGLTGGGNTINGVTLQDGNLAFVFWNAASSNIAYCILTTAGVVVKAATALTLAFGGATAVFMQLAAGVGQFGGFFIGATDRQGPTGYAVIDQTGNVLANVQVTGAGATSNYTPNAIQGMADGSALMIAAGGTNLAIRINSNTYDYVSGSVGAFLAGSGYHIKMVPLVPTWGSPNPLVGPFVVFCGGSVFAMSSLVPAVAPLGVSQNVAPVGQQAEVTINGQAYMRLTFKQPYNCDARCNIPPGQQMNIIGNVATMYGIQRSSPRNIN